MSKYLNTLGNLNRLIGLSILLYHLLVLVAMRGRGLGGGAAAAETSECEQIRHVKRHSQ